MFKALHKSFPVWGPFFARKTYTLASDGLSPRPASVSSTRFRLKETTLNYHALSELAVFFGLKKEGKMFASVVLAYVAGGVYVSVTSSLRCPATSNHVARHQDGILTSTHAGTFVAFEVVSQVPYFEVSSTDQPSPIS